MRDEDGEVPFHGAALPLSKHVAGRLVIIREIENVAHLLSWKADFVALSCFVLDALWPVEVALGIDKILQRQQVPVMGFPASHPPYHARPTKYNYSKTLVYGIYIYSYVSNLTLIPFSCDS